MSQGINRHCIFLFIACSASCHYCNNCRLIVDYTRNIFYLKFKSLCFIKMQSKMPSAKRQPSHLDLYVLTMLERGLQHVGSSANGGSITRQRLHYADGLVQDCSNSIANALELLQSCAKPSICPLWLTRIYSSVVCGCGGVLCRLLLLVWKEFKFGSLNLKKKWW